MSRLRTSSIAAGAAAVMLCAAVVAAQPAAAAPRAVPACTGADLSAKQTDSVAGMSQPASLITVTNISGHACVLDGYPRVTSARTKAGRQPVKVSTGNLMNAPDPGATRIVLRKGGHAWFAIGGATAYDPPVVTFTRITFATSPGGPRATSRVSLLASAPKGKPFPLTVTAFAPGVGKAS